MRLRNPHPVNESTLDPETRMLNYEMKYSVSEVARILGVDRDIVKTWASVFSDYLQPPANPSTGTPRQFCNDDLRVLAYVSMYWEDDPDIESIQSGLNSGENFEEPYNAFMATVTPIFRDFPDNINEDCRHGTIIGGWEDFGDTFALADSYKLAGDMLVDAAISRDEAYELICPIIYNYRHATELYMKAVLPQSKKNHDLLLLLREIQTLLKAEFNASIPSWFENLVLAFNDFDPNGTTFRYGGLTGFSKCGEAWVDIKQMKTVIGWMADAFQNIRRRRTVT
jgi:hypothetical protein